MGSLETLETQLNELLVKKAPFQIPTNGRKGIAGALWWIALVVGILQLWLAWGFWHVGHWVDNTITYLNNAYQPIYTDHPVIAHLGMAYYLALTLLVVDAVILLLAVSGLKAMSKSGWNWLFYSALLNAVYGLVRMFSAYGGFGDLLGTVIGSTIGLYVLFQVREYFMGKRVTAATAAASADDKDKKDKK